MSRQWTLENIRTEARKLSGRMSSTGLTDTNLDGYINEFYQNVLPGILGVHEFESFDTFTLTIDDGDYDIDADIDRDIRVICSPTTVAGNEVTLYTDPDDFYEIWPISGDPYDSGDVQDVLIIGRSIVFRPPPDSADEFKFLSKRVSPAALTDGDYPTDRRWGMLIAAGAAKILMEEKGEDTSSVLTIIEEQKTIFTREKVQMYQKTRTSKREL